MSNRTLRLAWNTTAVGVVFFLAAAVPLHAEPLPPTQATAANRPPRIRPDYNQIVIPPNIAPLNFLIEEPGAEFRVRLHGPAGKEILLDSFRASVVFPPGPWHDLLERNRGTNILVDIDVRGRDGRWTRFNPIENTVAPEKIDSRLVYRLIGPVASWFRDMGIYQRNLETFDESPILANDAIGHGCINCHSFQNNNPDTFSLHFRLPVGEKTLAGMVLVRQGKAVRINTESPAAPRPPGYLSWRPNSPTVAFAMIQPSLFFRGAGPETREEFDYNSAVAVMNVDTCAAVSSPALAAPDRLDTFPGWSADGQYLYFSSAKTPWDPKAAPTPAQIASVRHDLMRVAYIASNNTFGNPEVVLSSDQTGKSILEPRASPDGRYLLVCMTDYGPFPIYQAGSDLYLLDLKEGRNRRLECNSNSTDSWHCWSSNSRWFVFSSKRDNGLLARPYFCYFDAAGHEHKPFVLPQKDPTFYDTWLKTYNVPELVTGPVTISQEALAQAVLSGMEHKQQSDAGGNKSQGMR